MKPERWRQIEHLYNQVLEMEESQRTPFLREACAGDDDLRRELEQLLAEGPQASSFLEEPALREIAHEFVATTGQSWIGRQIGNYQFASLVGVGGMGEVYRARDTQLKRDVAIKILPNEFCFDPDRVSRFKREAEALASLNHTNIAAIYDLQEVNGSRFLILELVEGETLADRLRRGALPLDEALNIARQICEALDAAHEKGIVHRDLKPANIKIKPDGMVKVLDFGIAKVFMDNAAGGNSSEMPTPTNQGVILGTPAYMSPEQARGQAVDKRSDIWAFGSVLYEMLRGRRPFAGDTVSDELAAALRQEPNWDELPDATPVSIRRLLKRCLNKNPKHRLRDIGDARTEIEEAHTESNVLQQDSSGPKPQRTKLVGIIGVLAIVVAGVFALFYLRTSAEAPEMRLEITTPSTTNTAAFAISPDGQKLVFVASGDGQPRLWLRPLASGNPQPLAGTEGASYPFWDPQNRWVAFFADGSLKRVKIDGGSPQTLTSAARGRGGTWGPDGTIVFATGGNALFRVRETGGTAEPLTKLEPGQSSHRFPQFLPDGRRFLFHSPGHGIYLGSLDSVEFKWLTAAETAGVYAPQGWLLFVRQGKLVAQRFDQSQGALSGNPETVADSVEFDGNTASGAFSVSATGVVTYRVGVPSSRQLTWYNRSGKLLGNWGDPDAEGLGDPEISPDERQVLVSRTSGANTDVFRMDVTGRRTRLTLDAQTDSQAVWSSDGTQVAFSSTRNGNWDLFQTLSSGTGSEDAIRGTAEQEMINDWSRDGRFLLYVVQPRTALSDVWVLPMEGERKPTPIANTPSDERMAEFSPDGHWVAYQSDESGKFEIYVKPFPVRPGKWPVSKGGGIAARWSDDGKEIYYISPDAQLMTVPIAVIGEKIEAGTPMALFHTRIYGGGTSRLNRQQYDVASDGRFLINDTIEYMTTSPITVLLNWHPEHGK